VFISQAQKVHLKLIDSTNSGIELAYLKIYCNKIDKKISSYQSSRNGFFIIPESCDCNNVKIEITAPGYLEYYKEIKLNIYLNDTILCVLTKITVKNLSPIVVVAKSKPIQIKNDTTIYKVKAFSDGTEQKLNDILEKLPGIEVNKKSGEVRFKGKPIETILLEGDNLFGANYTLGSKNISANIVTEVQAIENYSENYVLKGLENEEKVALNIKLSKSKLDISGNSEIGSGVSGNQVEIASDINFNIIGLGQIHKFFSTLSYNNIGHNNSPVDYFGNNYSIEQIKEKKYAAQKFIYEPSFAIDNDKNYSNINSQFFGNHNTVFKLTPKIILKGNFFYLNDKIENQQVFENQYFVMNDTITNNDVTTGQKKPKAIKGDLNFRYTISAKALLEAVFSTARDDIQSHKTSFTDFIPVYQTNLQSDDRFNRFLVTYSKRINKTQALQIELRRTQNSISQIYDVYPSVFNRNFFTNDKQLSNFLRKYTHLAATLFGTRSKIRYNVYFKGIYDQNKYSSGIINNENNLTIVSSVNKVEYLKPEIAQGGNFNFDFGRLRLLTSYNLVFLQQQWFNKFNGSEISKNNFFFEPTIKFKYLLTRISALSFNYSYSLRNTNDQYLFPEIVIQNFRNATDNKVDLYLVKTNMAAFNYSRADLYNQFDNGFGVTLQTNDRDYLPTYKITDTLLFTTFSIGTTDNRILDIYLYINKYIPQVKASLKFLLNNTTNYYNNFLSPGLLRRNTNNTTAATIFVKTIFKSKINFETENSFSVNNCKSIVGNLISISSYVNKAKLIFIPNKTITMFVVSDYFLPNLSSNKGSLFLNFNLSFKPSKTKIELKLIANNVTNTLNILQYQVSDFSRSVFSSSTLPRNVLIYLAFKF